MGHARMRVPRFIDGSDRLAEGVVAVFLELGGELLLFLLEYRNQRAVRFRLRRLGFFHLPPPVRVTILTFNNLRIFSNEIKYN